MKILYICTHNRCRSILSEAITNHMGNGRILARSAGSQPSGEVHPLSIFYLEEQGIATDDLQSQSWDEFEDFAPDLVITVCDSAAGESCPLWFGKSLKIHWGLADPSKLQGSEEDKADAFRNTIKEIEQRVQQMLKLDLEHISQHQLQQALTDLGAQA
ncbi:arsenate reductase ArsC [Lacimicrobium alkaliphilum]|uniref:Arsenate reductase n=1 Tax=Lacimicrobium alkaliphilum TaxID=1526571 RepID=A0A0U2PLE7_9ALTE|nr:arsenate reductase ArsC [Lacimicrobium alkaliphilum]ALT00494.1 arsenate reductase [Lacimicrobium alkaliphilum]